MVQTMAIINKNQPINGTELLLAVNAMGMPKFQTIPNTP